jgi:hypothetical protein
MPGTRYQNQVVILGHSGTRPLEVQTCSAAGLRTRNIARCLPLKPGPQPPCHISLGQWAVQPCCPFKDVLVSGISTTSSADPDELQTCLPTLPTLPVQTWCICGGVFVACPDVCCLSCRQTVFSKPLKISGCPEVSSWVLLLACFSHQSKALARPPVYNETHIACLNCDHTSGFPRTLSVHADLPSANHFIPLGNSYVAIPLMPYGNLKVYQALTASYSLEPTSPCAHRETLAPFCQPLQVSLAALALQLHPCLLSYRHLKRAGG